MFPFFVYIEYVTAVDVAVTLPNALVEEVAVTCARSAVIAPLGDVTEFCEIEILVFDQVALSNSSDLKSRLELLSSISSPLQSRLTESWSKRATSIAADWISPSLPTKVAVDARVSVGVGPLRAVSVLSAANWRSRESPIPKSNLLIFGVDGIVAIILGCNC
jgi:hypothetical protein